MFVHAISVIAAEEESGVALLLPDTAELIGGIIAFGLVFFFMWKWAFPAINRMLEQRQAAIGGQIEDAEKAKAEAEKLLADYKAQLAEARAEGNRIIEEARAAAEKARADIVAKAEAEAEQIRSKAREDAAQERVRALSQAREQVGDISVDLAGRLVGASLDADAHRELIERYLSQLEKL